MQGYRGTHRCKKGEGPTAGLVTQPANDGARGEGSSYINPQPCTEVNKAAVFAWQRACASTSVCTGARGFHRRCKRIKATEARKRGAQRGGQGHTLTAPPHAL
jgi:hypothetical protein